MNRDQWRAICLQELGKPYTWGAEGPDAYDCSGFVQWALRQINLDPPGDQTAAGLYEFFGNGRSERVDEARSMLGDLVFFGPAEGVTHVALALGDGQMLEAGGGGRKTTSVALARQQRAEVRIRGISNRKDLVEILRPTAPIWPERASVALAEAVVGAVESYGGFIDSPPLMEWLDDGRHMRLKKPFSYVEDAGRVWSVPAEAVVDGASIPRVFWSLIGGPFEGLYRNASVVHDYYCDTGTRPWRDTHRVFYEAMRCSGVGSIRAKTMYYAVYRFGPRWAIGPSAVAESFGVASTASPVPAPLPVEQFDAASFEADARLILSGDLDIHEIEFLAERRRMGSDGVELAFANTTEGYGRRAESLRRLSDEAGAAFARQPLLERLVALQDAATNGASAQAVGALLSQYSSDVLVRARSVTAESAHTFDALKPTYEALYASCVIRPERLVEVAWHLKKLAQYRTRYESVAAETGVPWWFISVVHALEASFNFSCHLHNGDPLSARTVHVPKNRPSAWSPPTDWESSAVDALKFKNFAGVADWSLANV